MDCRCLMCLCPLFRTKVFLLPCSDYTCMVWSLVFCAESICIQSCFISVSLHDHFQIETSLWLVLCYHMPVYFCCFATIGKPVCLLNVTVQCPPTCQTATAYEYIQVVFLQMSGHPHFCSRQRVGKPPLNAMNESGPRLS